MAEAVLGAVGSCFWSGPGGAGGAGVALQVNIHGSPGQLIGLVVEVVEVNHVELVVMEEYQVEAGGGSMPSGAHRHRRC